ncbi:M23 family metallopeptidase [Actinopolymorpha sp. B9G3]|uniref:M23 family metallopeptidase n=1 Tax=Actinopolymorpha sp. B9G3 TaxID=3158970 RepID=UPI0032D955A8
MESFLRRIRTLWTFRWRKIPLTMVATALAVCGAGVGTAVAVGGTSATPQPAAASGTGERAAGADVHLARDAARARAARERAGRSRADAKHAASKVAAKTAAATKAAARKAAARKAAAKKAAARKAAARKAAAKRGAVKAARKPDWVLPVESYHLTGRFGASGNRWASSHHGLDFAAPSGTPIRAVGSGEIIASGWDGAYGNRIKVLHPNGTVTLYGHMSRFERSSGSVDAGTVIGYIGATGNATGPHLHLEVRPDNGGLYDTIDPEDWLEDKGLDP